MDTEITPRGYLPIYFVTAISRWLSSENVAVHDPSKHYNTLGVGLDAARRPCRVIANIGRKAADELNCTAAISVSVFSLRFAGFFLQTCPISYSTVSTYDCRVSRGQCNEIRDTSFRDDRERERERENRQLLCYCANFARLTCNGLTQF